MKFYTLKEFERDVVEKIDNDPPFDSSTIESVVSISDPKKIEVSPFILLVSEEIKKKIPNISFIKMENTVNFFAEGKKQAVRPDIIVDTGEMIIVVECGRSFKKININRLRKYADILSFHYKKPVKPLIALEIEMTKVFHIENSYSALTKIKKEKYTGIVITQDGKKLFFRGGNLHREDGAAVIHPVQKIIRDGVVMSHQKKEYYLDGKMVTKSTIDYRRQK